jgi:hypothetical protein
MVPNFDIPPRSSLLEDVFHRFAEEKKQGLRQASSRGEDVM